MLDEKKSALRFGTLRHGEPQSETNRQGNTLSLLPLRMALINAEKESPPCAPKRQLDVNEELALKLIRRMKKQYKRNYVIARATLAPARKFRCSPKQSPL